MASTRKGFIVKKSFQDAPEYRINGEAVRYHVGEDVTDFDPERLKKLVGMGFIEGADVPALDEEPAKPETPETAPVVTPPAAPATETAKTKGK